MSLRGLPTLERFELQYEPELNTGCWLWTGSISGLRYGGITHEGKDERAHRVSWILFRGPIPDGINVLHKCDTTLCVNPDHLFLGTQAVNVLDMHAKGRATPTPGERNGRAKLVLTQVIEIRCRASENRDDLAGEFHVSTSLITQIINDKVWKGAVCHAS